MRDVHCLALLMAILSVKYQRRGLPELLKEAREILEFAKYPDSDQPTAADIFNRKYSEKHRK